jgi:hypothetical protein
MGTIKLRLQNKTLTEVFSEVLLLGEGRSAWDGLNG